jgi:uroporphyrin-III C-methyltransferase/precorrin-2 dehydrogenase/sirohydrochlorin ferrochelatase
MYPILVNLENRRCLVVGGGGVALRKVSGLVAEKARVVVVSPEPIAPLLEMADKGEITLERRSYRSSEAADYSLVFAATDDRGVNQQVFNDARKSGVLANVADDPELCAFHLPARMIRGSLQIVIASGGEAPFVVRRLRQALEKRFGPEWAEWMEAAARLRKAVRERRFTTAEQEVIFDRFFEKTVDMRKLAARVPTEAELDAWISERSNPLERPQDITPQELSEKAKVGFVSLVGAGPGDAGLLTLRGRQRLMAADAVVYDRLAATALPTDLASRVELHCVGKQSGNHPVPQEEISALLVRLAKEGKKVVRFKGGDPFMFGRGGEEAEALVAADIPFEVVPGITAGIAVPAYTGIPITHRRDAAGVMFVTAHESAKKEGPQVRWDLLAGDSHATLIGYMGVTNLPNVVEKLLKSGMDAKTPAAVIRRGTTSQHSVVYSPVVDLPQAVERAGLKPPALFVIGSVVRYAQKLGWFERRPLFGERIAVVAPAREIGAMLETAGAEVIEVPLPVTPAARVVIGALPLTRCVLRNAVEVDALAEERDSLGWGPQMTAWCLNVEAAQRARRLGWTYVEQIEVYENASDWVRYRSRGRE